MFDGQREANLLSVLDDLMYIQENNGVNAVFAIAVFNTESGCGTGWDLINSSTHNWQSVHRWGGGVATGSYTDRNGTTWASFDSFNQATRDFGIYISTHSAYFRSGSYSVFSIAPTYCNEAWGTTVAGYMEQFLAGVGIDATRLDEIRSSHGIDTSSGGNGSDSDYDFDDVGGSGTTVGNGTLTRINGRGYWGTYERGGKKYILWYQNYSPSTGQRQGGGATNWDRHSGLCGVTSFAIIEGAKGNYVTPGQVYDRYGWSFRAGLGYPAERSPSQFNAAVNALQQNRPVVIDMAGYAHFFPILDIKDGYLLVINSWWDGSTSLPTFNGGFSSSGFPSGWYPINNVKNQSEGFYIGG